MWEALPGDECEGEDDDSEETEGDAGEGERGGALGAEEEDFAGEDPDGNHGGDDGGEAGGDAGLSPEEAGVEAGEHDEAEDGGGEELRGAEVEMGPVRRLHMKRMRPARVKRNPAAKKGGTTATISRMARKDPPQRM